MIKTLRLTLILLTSAGAITAETNLNSMTFEELSLLKYKGNLIYCVELLPNTSMATAKKNAKIGVQSMLADKSNVSLESSISNNSLKEVGSESFEVTITKPMPINYFEFETQGVCASLDHVK
ncbi:hypothetical protein ACMAZF_20400 (plasmid) [Psychrobium sp. nBUS_13]|uniref:hypothetical protein n=1 Tax=Psychrobium sp. nBUS_13 TaxID=3395319 RepID=UPI003EBC6C33